MPKWSLLEEAACNITLPKRTYSQYIDNTSNSGFKFNTAASGMAYACVLFSSWDENSLSKL